MAQIVNKFLAQVPANTLKGNNTGSTANVTDLTVTQLQSMLSVPTSSSPLSLLAGGTGISAASANAAYNALTPMSTIGDMEYESATGIASRLPVGTTGQVLTVVSGIPAWASSTTGANQYLSNLLGPTAINQSLTFDTGGPYTINPADFSGSGMSISLLGGNTTGVHPGGAVNITGGNAASGTQGGAVNITGGAGHSQHGGFVSINGGASDNFNGGGVTLQGAAANTTGNGGAILITSGAGGSSSGGGGDINIAAAGSTTGLGGNVILVTSPGVSTNGLIQLQDGTQGTAGYVWTSVDTSGSGSWMAPAVSGITQLTGDITAGPGSGSQVANLVATSNGTLTTLSALATAVSLASVGTITSGTWHGTAIDATHGGTAQTSYASGDTLYASASNTLSKLSIGSSGQVLTVVSGIPAWATPTTGTVTSVAFADASTTPIYGISGTPVTSTGTLTQTLLTQTANTIFAGPSSGSAAQPTFRTLVAADIPSLSATYVTQSEVGAASGVASLDGGGKVPLSQLPATLMEFKGSWNPNTNTPTLIDGTGTTGFTYWVSAARSTAVSGLNDPSMVNFQIGDLVIYNGTAWVLVTPAAGVSSVNGAQGAVVVTMASTNGFAGTYSGTALTVSTTITGLLKGNGTAISAATAGTDYVIPSGSITGTAANITATSNSTITTLSALSLPYSQVTGTPTGGAYISTPFKDTFVVAGSQQTFTLTHTPLSGSVSFLVKGGGDQLEGSSYDFTVSGAVVTLQNGLATGGVSALVNGDVVQIQYQY